MAEEYNKKHGIKVQNLRGNWRYGDDGMNLELNK